MTSKQCDGAFSPVNVLGGLAWPPLPRLCLIIFGNNPRGNTEPTPPHTYRLRPAHFSRTVTLHTRIRRRIGPNRYMEEGLAGVLQSSVSGILPILVSAGWGCGSRGGGGGRTRPKWGCDPLATRASSSASALGTDEVRRLINSILVYRISGDF